MESEADTPITRHYVPVTKDALGDPAPDRYYVLIHEQSSYAWETDRTSEVYLQGRIDALMKRPQTDKWGKYQKTYEMGYQDELHEQEAPEEKP